MVADAATVDLDERFAVDDVDVADTEIGTSRCSDICRIVCSCKVSLDPLLKC